MAVGIIHAYSGMHEHLQGQATHVATGVSCILPASVPKLCTDQYRPQLCGSIHGLHNMTSWAYFNKALFYASTTLKGV